MLGVSGHVEGVRFLIDYANKKKYYFEFE